MSLCHLPSQMEPQVPWCQRLPLRFLTGPVRTQVVLSPEKREGAGEVVIQQRGQTGRTESILGLCGAIISLDLDARILWSQPESRAGGLGPWLVPTSRGYPRSCTDNRCQGEGGVRFCSRAIPPASLEFPTHAVGFLCLLTGLCLATMQLHTHPSPLAPWEKIPGACHTVSEGPRVAQGSPLLRGGSPSLPASLYPPHSASVVISPPPPKKIPCPHILVPESALGGPCKRPGLGVRI